MNAPAHGSMAGLLAARARGRLKPGERNKTEAAYERHLEGLKASGDVLWFAFEFITLKLAARTTYTADFAVMRADGAMELHEVKGNRWEDDARVKTKVAAAMSPFRIVAVRALPKCKGGGWEVEEF